MLEGISDRNPLARAATAWQPTPAPHGGDSVARIPAPRRVGSRAGTPPHAAIPAAPGDAAVFSAELLRLVPKLRAYSRSLAPRVEADDLMQDALLRAWIFRAKYQPDTNLQAWVFTIMRNLRLSGLRRAWRNQPIGPDIAETTLLAHDDPSASEELLDVRNAMHRMPCDQRDALIMVGPAGLSYKEVAGIWGCAEGTVKSRVSRARKALTDMLETSEARQRAKTNVSSSEVFEEIMQHATRLRGGLALT